MMRTFLVLAAVILVFPWGDASAGRTYKWIDKDGGISYHDRPPPANSGYRVEETHIRAGGSATGDDTSEAAASSDPVVLYSVPQCSPCDLARDHLKKRKVPFSEKNVATDPKLQQELKQKAGSLSVPTITVGSTVLNTYAAGWLDAELDRAGYGAGSEAESEEAEESEEGTGGLAPTE